MFFKTLCRHIDKYTFIFCSTNIIITYCKITMSSSLSMQNKIKLILNLDKTKAIILFEGQLISPGNIRSLFNLYSFLINFCWLFFSMCSFLYL